MTAPKIGVTVRMTAQEHAELKALAEREHRSLSQEMRRMLEQHLVANQEPAA